MKEEGKEEEPVHKCTKTQCNKYREIETAEHEFLQYSEYQEL